MSERYPGAIWRPSSIQHDRRSRTAGIVIHWTVGREGGDIGVLDGPNVDCQLYVAKDGDVYQFLDMDSEGWHAKSMANNYCIGIEHEGAGEPWTQRQLEESAKASAYLCKRYGIPPLHVDPSGRDLSTFHGLFGHRDLSLGGIRVDGNDHTDSVPDGTGWDKYLKLIKQHMGLGEQDVVDLDDLPFGGSLRLHLAGNVYSGWDQAAPAIRWVAKNGAKDPKAAISYRGPDAKKATVWRGPKEVTNVCKSIVRELNL